MLAPYLFDWPDQGLAFDCLRGDLKLFHQLLDGEWNEEDFLVVPVGQRIAASADGQRISSVAKAP